MPAYTRGRSFVVAVLAIVGMVLASLAAAAPADAAHRHRHHRHHHHRAAASAPSGGSGLSGRAEHVALRQVGDPYRYGATGPGAFDCSGLVYYSYRAAGKRNVARSSSAQAGQARHIARSAMQPGDLMFFHDGGGVYHVAIFTGWRNGHATMVHSPRPGERVQRSAPWTNSWFAGTFR